MTYVYSPASTDVGNPEEVGGAKEWLTMPIPAAFWTELRSRPLVRPDAPSPVTA